MRRVKKIDGVEIYDLILDRNNILAAIDNAALDHARDPDVIRMLNHKEEYADIIYSILATGHFDYSKFITRDIFERGKKRHLCYSRTFPDRVIQHAVLQVVGPILLKTCNKDTYAAQKGRGTHKCSMNLRKALRSDTELKYYFKGDIHKYFDSIDREVLFKLIKRKIKCARTLGIMHDLIFKVPGKKGLAIGLYLSQVLAVFMLSYFMHFVKEVLHAPRAYLYMDDIIILAETKGRLHRIRKAIQYHLKTEYHLKLKSNWCIRPISTGIDFVGFVHYTTHTRIRKKNKVRYIHMFRIILKIAVFGKTVTSTLIASLESYAGMISWCDGKNLIRKYHSRLMMIFIRLGNRLKLSRNAHKLLDSRLQNLSKAL